MLIEKNSTLVMQGDSITDAGRTRPVGEGNDNLGGGYVQYVAAFLAALYPERKIRVQNTGVSGNTSRQLLERWQEDTLELAPDWVSIMIGANDVWRHNDRPLLSEALVSLDEYKENLTRILELTLPKVQGVVLLSPYYMGQSQDDTMRIQMLEYAQVARELAAEYKLPFGETQALFDEHLQHYHAHSLSWDCIHPNHTGALLIAKSFLNAVNVDWDRMTIR